MFDRPTPMIAILLAGTLGVGGCAGNLSLGAPQALTTGSLAELPVSPTIGKAAAKPIAAPLSDAPAAAGQAAPGQAAAGRAAPEAAITTKTATAATPPALVLARALRDKGDKSKALAEVERSRQDKPADRELAREAGILALELGLIDKAKKSLTLALDPAAPDFHTLAALGTAHASSGNQRDAQTHFSRALVLKPDHQPTLNNLALSYALDGNLAKAEATLKSMAKGSQPPHQVKENLALVLALAGKFDDAEKVAAGVMPKAAAAANIAYVRQLTDKENGG